MTVRRKPDSALAYGEDPASQFLRLLAGKWVVSAIATAAQLQLAEQLDQPRTAQQLAELCNAHTPSLERLLGVLVGEGLLERHPNGTFSLTDTGEQLRAKHLGQLARFVGSASQWTPWLHLDYAVRTGQSAFAKAHGQPLFEYLAQHPAEAELYDSAVDAFTRQQAHALADTEVLHDASTVVDVGGGRGTFLLELMRRNTQLRGVLFERTNVVGAARQRIEDNRENSQLLERVSFQAGDFFDAVPPGADAYVLKHVVHNWADEPAVQLLRNCQRAMSDGGCVLVVEGLLLPGNVRDGTRLMDLEMLVLTGQGRERSKPEFRQLFARAGLRLTQTHRLSFGAWLMVTRRA